MAKKIEKSQPRKATAVKSSSAATHVTETEFALTKENYILFGIGFALIILGFFLMSGTEDIMSFRKLHLSTIVLMTGYLFNIYAIIKRPKANA